MAIKDEIKASFKEGSVITKLIYVNFGVFIVVKLWDVFFSLSGTPDIRFSLSFWLTAPGDLALLITKPWTIITYMFVHADFLHIFFNMLMTFWFGKFFLQHFTPKQLLTTFFLGGISGYAFHLMFYNIASSGGPGLVGASAAVMAILVGIAFYIPNSKINLMFIGPVKLKYLALAIMFMDVMGMASMDGIGHIAHLGGALYGILFISRYKKGHEIGKGFSKFLDWVFSFFKPRKKMHVSYKNSTSDDWKYNREKATSQKEIDKILDKIAKAGYNSLSKKEKEILFKMGKN